MMDRKVLAVKIKSARTLAGLSQVYMAERLSVARQTYLDLETGKTEPKINTLLKICKLTDMPLAWFIKSETTREDTALAISYPLNILIPLYQQLPSSVQNPLINIHIKELKVLLKGFNTNV